MKKISTMFMLWMAGCMLFSVSSFSQETVKTSTGELTIPTYPWRGKDDINPSFRSTSNPMYSPHTTTYPYPTQDNISKTKVDQKYKTMTLENEYLKVVVIPELGGHVHSVYDKITGESIVYDPGVVKPTLIGLRGAWTPGGIEFNTGPQGHTVTALSPVEAKFVDYADGSKAIAIGNIEQVYHTQWVVTVRLRPGRSFLEENIRIYNPTDNKHLYYFWNCVAVANTDSAEWIYPMTLGQDHWGKTFYPWPVENGKNISLMKNHTAPVGVFAYRCDQNFYGQYDRTLDKGLITYSNHYELEGKKSWTWSKGRWGARFQASMIDDKTTYNEIQTGPMPTQADYGVLNPHQTVEWQEWWYPVRGTKGVAFSNKDVTVNVLKDDKKKSMSLLLHGTGKWEATCSIEKLGEQKVSISPEKAASLIFMPKNLKDTVHIVITSGTTKLADFTYPLRIPQRTAPEKPRELPSETTAAGCWLRGVQSCREGGQHLGKDWFKKAIQKDENFSAAMTSLGELEVNAGEYASAKKLLERSTKLNVDDGWALYYLAQCDRELGLMGDALEMAYHAAHCTESASAGYSLAGALLLEQGNYSEAIEPLRKALDFNAQDLASRNLLAFALWKSGDNEGATRELKDVQRRDALDMASGIILKMMGTEDKEFASRISGRAEEVMSMADFFIKSGLKKEAAWVIKEYYLNAATKEAAPLAYYYYGILANDAQVLAQGMEANPDFVFPNSRQGRAILEETVKRQPKDWKAKYYLGNYMFEHALKDAAVKLWKDAAAINNSYSVIHRNLGLVAWKMDNNYWQASMHYEKAISCNPNDLSLYRDLATIYVDHMQQYGRAKDMLEKMREKSVRADVVSLLARTYNFLGEYDKAIALLAADNYSNWEGRGSLYNIYIDAHVGKGEQLFNKGDYEGALKEFRISTDYPNNLGPGIMEDPEIAKSRYWGGLTLEKMGKKEEAIKEWKIAAAEAERGSEENKKFGLLAKNKI